MYTTNRTFTHRTFGQIGEVNLVVEAPAKGKIVATLDGKELPEASVEYLLTFALQSLQDAYAGAKTAEDASAAFDKKRNALIAGSIGVRTGGGGISEELRVRRQIVMEAVRAAARKAEGKSWKDSAKKAEIEAMGEEAWNEKLDGAYARNEETFAPLVAAEMERLAAMRATKKEAKAIALDI